VTRDVRSPAARPLAARRAPRLSALARVFQQEDLNFLLTNRIPRRLATRFMGWFSRVEQPLVRDLSLFLWKCFAGDLDLSDAKKDTFDSLHDCFVRELRAGARPVAREEGVLVSPCDGIVGAHGRVDGTEVFQAKGFPYTLEDLLGDSERVEAHRDGTFVTLRLTSTMVHRFHAPCAGRLREVVYVSGDTWNVNPIALRRIERLFCKNERAVLPLETDVPGLVVTLVPVAAILVASLRLHCLDETLDLAWRGPNHIPCDASFDVGDELGWFEHGSTILVFVSGDVELADGVAEGAPIRMGRPLLRLRGAG
jgi:phosphatidylserine decarboxylase